MVRLHLLYKLVFCQKKWIGFYEMEQVKMGCFSDPVIEAMFFLCIWE